MVDHEQEYDGFDGPFPADDLEYDQCCCDMFERPCIEGAFSHERWSCEDFYWWIRPVSAEFVGTMIYVFSGIMTYESMINASASSLIVAAMGYGLAAMMLIATLGPISGGHFNPATTLGVAVTGHMNFCKAFLYMFAQFGGALSGAAIVVAVIPEKEFQTINLGVNNTNTSGSYQVNEGGAFILEMVAMAFVVFAYMGSAVQWGRMDRWTVGKKQNQHWPLHGLIVGFAYTCAHFWTWGHTSAGLHPAKSLATMFLTLGDDNDTDGSDSDGSAPDRAQEQIWLFVVAPLVGGILGASIFQFHFLIRQVEYARVQNGGSARKPRGRGGRSSGRKSSGRRGTRDITESYEDDVSDEDMGYSDESY